MVPPRIFNGFNELLSAVGHDIGVSGFHKISLNLIAEFSAVAGDRQWIHLDKKRTAIESPYKVPIAQGYLLLSLLPMLMRESFELPSAKMVINYGLNKVRFPAALPAEAEVRAHFQLLTCEINESGFRTTIAATMEQRGEGKPVCVAELVHQWT